LVCWWVIDAAVKPVEVWEREHAQHQAEEAARRKEMEENQAKFNEAFDRQHPECKGWRRVEG
jgi:hypothetical protein